MNRVTLVGNLTDVPDYTAAEDSKSPRCTFTLAVSERYQKDGEWVNGNTQYVPVVCWGKLANHVFESLTKGDRCFVEGKLSIRSTRGDDDKAATRFVDVNASFVGPELTFTSAAFLEGVSA